MKSSPQRRYILLIAATLGLGAATVLSLELSFSNTFGTASVVASGSPIGATIAGEVGESVDEGAATGQSTHAMPVRGPVEVPEPASMILLGTGLVGLAGLVRRTNRER